MKVHYLSLNRSGELLEKLTWQFFLIENKKQLGELIESAQTSSTAAANEKLSRMDKVKIAFEKNCEKSCDEKCLSCASEVLHRTNIYPHVFAAAIRDLLQNG